MSSEWTCKCGTVNPTFDPWCSRCEEPQPEQAASSTQAIENFTARFTMARQILREHGNAGLVALLDQLADKTASSTTPASGGVGDARDAARWRALLAGRVRVIGSAGLHSELDPYGQPWNGYAHIGLELWTKHDAPNYPNAAETLTKYADIAALTAAQEGAQGERGAGE